MLEFRILGPLEVVADGRPLALGGPRQRATLAILVLSANRVVSVDELADALYAGAPPVTAVTQVQRQISELRKALGAGAEIETRAPGYVLRLVPEQLDLARFEALTDEAARARARGNPARAVELVRESLALWRGAPLGDLGYESFAQAPIARLEELRLAALEERFDDELELGRHTQIAAELEGLVRDHPLHEELAAQLMLALYRSGRQADALTVFRRTRSALVDEVGIEPSARLRSLEQSILRQDSTLDDVHPAEPDARPRRPVLVAASTDDALDAILRIAADLGADPDHELILARLVRRSDEVTAAAEAVNARRSALAVEARSAAFASESPVEDILRLESTYGADLVLVDGALGQDRVPPELAELFTRSTADVAVLAASGASGGPDVVVPFGGGEHDWAAAELAAWLARNSGRGVAFVGTRADPPRGRRDASRLLADAALAVQQVGGVETLPLLVDASVEALRDVVSDAAVVVAGVGDHWRRSGVGAARRALIDAGPPLLLVHRGLRPGGLAPRTSGTRFTWSIAPGGYSQAVSTAPT